MRNVYLLLCLMIASFAKVSAQTPGASQYLFATSTGVQLEDMSDGNLLLGVGEDDDNSAVTSMPFSFEFAGNTYASFDVNPNGIFEFRPAPSGMAVPQLLIVWGQDMATNSDGHVKYKVVGTTQRKLIVEWFCGDYQASGIAHADKRFQLWLFEGSNKAQFVYGAGMVDEYTESIVGISGNYLVDMKLVKTDSHITTSDPNWANSQWPGTGRTYSFSPFEETVPSPSPVVAIEAAGSTILCQGASVVFNTSLTDATAPTYQWFKNDIEISGATYALYTASESGNYKVKVVCANGIAISQTVTVVMIDLNATASATNLTCNQTSNGTITIGNETGGSGEYEYRLNNGAWQVSNNFSGLSAGTYSVQMRDMLDVNCIKTIGSTTIGSAGTAPIVTIAASSKETCATIKLTANPANAMGYLWSNGSTSRTIELSKEDADGNYTVSVSTTGGCAASASYQYKKQNLLKSYTMVGLKYVVLNDDNYVNGGVGNTGNNKLIIINKNTTVNGFVKGDYVVAAPSVNVSGGVSYSPANVTIPVMRPNTSSTGNLPVKNVGDNYNGTVIAGNYKKITIGKKAKVTLTGNVFGKIDVKEGADVTFAAGEVSIDELKTDDGKASANSIDFTTVTFASNAVVKVKNKVVIGDFNKVSGNGATLFVGDLDDDDERVVVNGKGTEMAVNIYLPNGILAVRNAEANKRCDMTGLFIAEVILSDKYVNWNSNLCNTSLLTPKANPANSLLVPAVVDTKLVKAYPNPTAGNVTIQMNTTKVSNAAVSIYNQNGLQLWQKTFTMVQPGQSLPIDLKSYPAGTYMVQIKTAEGVQTAKVIIQK